MEAIIRNVREIEPDERRVLEHVLGRTLKDNQQVIIQVVSLDAVNGQGQPMVASERLPDWCNVYEGLSDDQIGEIEEVILQRADLTRSAD